MSGAGDRILDNGLLALTTESDRVFLCAADPVSFTDANTTHVGVKNGSRGSMFYSLSSPPAGGRMASLAGFNDGTITSNGNANYVVVADSVFQNILVSEALATPKAVKVGGLFSINALDIILGKSSQPQAADLIVGSPQLGPVIFAKAPVNTSNVTVSSPFIGAPILVSTHTGWTNIPIATVVGLFTCAFDAVPTALGINDLAGLSNGVASDYPQLACLVRFGAANIIEVRNGAAYAADTPITYIAGTRYHVRLVGNLNNHTYSVFVTPQGSGETQIAANYAFRTEQAAITQITNFAINLTDTGLFTVSNITFNSLDAVPLTVGSPAFPSPVLNGKLNFVASSFATLSPTFSSAAFLQTHYLRTLASYDTGSPTFTTPSLTKPSGVPAGAFSDQTGSFAIQLDAVPSNSLEDVVTGLSNGVPGDVTAIACGVRFYTDGVVSVRNGSTWTASATVPYSGGMNFHVRMNVRIASHTYDVFITPQGQSEILLANNFAFRTEQAAATTLNYLGKLLFSDGPGDCALTNMIPPPPMSIPPTVLATNMSVTLPVTLGMSVGTMRFSGGAPTSWAITAGNASGYFAIANSGLITVTSAGVSGITATTYSLTCQATNSFGSTSGVASVAVSATSNFSAIPLTFNNSSFTGMTEYSNQSFDVAPTESFSRASIQNTVLVGLAAIGVFENTGINASINFCRVIAPEVMRFTEGTVTVNNSHFQLANIASGAHADGIQCYSGTNQTGCNLTLNNTAIFGQSSYVTANIWVAQHFAGEVHLNNVVLGSTTYGIRVVGDITPGVDVYFNGVYFVGPFVNGRFFFQGVSYGLPGHITIKQWTNVFDATIVNGVLVPGAAIPQPPND